MRIARVFFDTHMGKNFAGLRKILREAGMNPDTVTSPVVFINTQHTKFKLLSQGYLAYYDNGTRKFPLTALQYLPQAFGGTDLDLKRAMSVAMYKDLTKKLKLADTN